MSSLSGTRSIFPVARTARTDAPCTYQLPGAILLGAIWAFIRGQRRNEWVDCVRLNDQLAHAPVIRHADRLPMNGPAVFLPNHYERKDQVWVGWGAIALTSALARHRGTTESGHIHWVMTDTWTDAYIGPIHVPPKMLGWVLAGFSRVFGLIRMPAHDLPNHNEQRARSASAIRDMADVLATGNFLAVHPEAGGFETLVTPPPGAGRMLRFLERRGAPMIPVGIFEENDRLVINVGEPLPPHFLHGMTDAVAAAAVMNTIKALIPAQNHGDFAGEDELPTTPADQLP